MKDFEILFHLVLYPDGFRWNFGKIAENIAQATNFLLELFGSHVGPLLALLLCVPGIDTPMFFLYIYISSFDFNNI